MNLIMTTQATGFATGYLILGILAVIAIIALLAAVVVLIAKICKVVDHVAVSPSAPAPVYTAQASTPLYSSASASSYSDAIRLINVDDKTAAMIMAIVSDEIKVPVDKLRFRSIRCID